MKFYQRGKDTPIPDDLTIYLNRMQLLALCQAEAADWHLQFVRRPAFADPTVVIASSDHRQIAIVTQNGTIDSQPAIQVRSPLL